MPLILEIDFYGKKGMYRMNMESSFYPEEDEVLVQDGLCYKVVSVESQLKKDTK